MKAPQNSRGFTLIELLAVIAILLVLLSLLVPGLSKVKDRAYQVTCMSNVRQVVAAIIRQSGDNEGYVTSPNWGTHNQSGWLTYVNRWPNTDTLKTGLLWPFLNEEAVYRCPADPQPAIGDTSRVAWYPQDTRFITSYNMNGSACGYGTKPFGTAGTSTNAWVTYKFSEFRPTDIMYWEGNENAPSLGWWWDGANYPNEGISARHDGAGTVASMGGHVERMLSSDYWTLERLPTKNRLWNKPDTANGRR